MQCQRCQTQNGDSWPRLRRRTSRAKARRPRSDYEQAVILASDLGMRPLVAHCRRKGQRERAQHHLTTATTMYREKDMEFWIERAEEAQMREPA